MHTTPAPVGAVATERDRTFRERTFHYRSHHRHTSAGFPAHFVRPLWTATASLVCLSPPFTALPHSFVFFPADFPQFLLFLFCRWHFCFETSVPPSYLRPLLFVRGGGSVSVYIHIYMYIAICIYMYICEQMGEKGWSFDLSLCFPFFFFFLSLIFVDLSCPFIPRVSSKIFLEYPFPVLIAETVTTVPLPSPLYFFPPLPVAL